MGFTCFTAPGTLGCQGRKKKRRSLVQLVDHSDKALDKNFALDPSEELNALEKEVNSSGSSGKLLFTVWRTSFSTKTTTSFSTNRDNTVSLKVACTIQGIQEGTSPLCGGK